MVAAVRGEPARARLGWGVGLVAILAALPWFVGSYTLAVLIDAFIYAVFALSYNLLLGYTGILSLGHALFFGLGAYAIAIPVVRMGWPLGQAVLLGLGLSVAAALLLGSLGLRVRGVYFSMVTLAFAEIVHVLALKLSRFTGGEDGITRIPAPPWLADRTSFYYFALLVLVAVYLALKRLMSSPFGRSLVAIRENEARAAALGYNVFAHKLVCMVIAGVLATLSGMGNAMFFSYVSPGVLSVLTTIDVLLMTMVGGAGTLIGPVLGAGVVQVLDTVLSSVFRHWLLIFGLIYILIVLFLPKGIVGTTADWWARRRTPAPGTQAPGTHLPGTHASGMQGPGR
ncbi:MAG: hypothetical protein BAA04_11155 [Firmicutes bacterium ZCTH02-B6]|nr:MAG: hypothetical protein BAA04_11155 [Firmicutes bacterium ZCTH02-B6]